MKTLIKYVTTASLLCAALVRCDAKTNLTSFDKILSAIGTPTNYAVEPYFTYAPKAPQKYGGGILGIYNVSEHVGLGLGLDWLGHFSLINANVSLQAPFHPIRSESAPLWARNVVLSPFVLAGIGTAYSGAGSFNGGVSTVEDAGAYIKFGHALGGNFNVGACYGQWTGVGAYDVKRYHVFVGWSHGF